MPVRSLTQSLLRWPEPELILAQVAAWAAAVAADHPGLVRVGVFGSYGRGDAGVGSDLDLLLIDRQAAGPQHQRLLAWPPCRPASQLRCARAHPPGARGPDGWWLGHGLRLVERVPLALAVLIPGFVLGPAIQTAGGLRVCASQG
jgi:hypothetical protein